MNPAKFYVGLLVAVVLAVGVSIFAGHYSRLQDASAQNQSRGKVLENTSAGVVDAQQNFWLQQAYTQGLAAGRVTFADTLIEAKRNEPETAARAVRPVPDSVRDAYRARRLARERLGCAGDDCPE